MTQAAQLLSEQWPWFWPTVVFVFGACIGSFLNVCIYRIPAGKSIVRPGSTCACGQPIAWYDNLPVLSWFFLRGKARCCKRAFGFRYPLVEALTGGIFLAISLLYPPLQAIPLWVFAALLLTGTFIDWDTMELPDVVTVGGTVCGLVFSCVLPALHGQTGDIFLVNAIRGGLLGFTGALVGSGLIVWIREFGHVVFRREAMGLGDVVLMGCIGSFCGWQGALFAVFGGSVVGAVVMIPWVLFQRLRHKGSEGIGETAVPFGPWLAAGAFIYVLGARAGVDAYFDNLKSLIFP